MKQTRDIMGGWYGECTVDGLFAVSVRDKGVVMTEDGALVAPELVGTSCWSGGMRGGFKIAGQLHDGTQNVEFTGSTWNPVGPSYGTNPVCYDHQGKLWQGSPVYGSQGIRYVDDTGIHTGDDTYAKPGVIYEYTQRGDLIVGQGPDSGAIVIAPEGTFELEPGDCRFVKFNRQNDLLAITIVKLTERKTVLLWLSRSEIVQFPRLSRLDHVPGPINVIDTQKETLVPTIPETEVTRAKAMLAAVRREWNFGSNQNDTPYTREVAARLGGNWGLNGKRGDPSNISHDILAYAIPGGQPILVDVLIDGGGANGPGWDVLEYPQPAGAVWVDPGKPQDGSKTPQNAPGSTQPPPVDLGPIVQAINALGAAGQALEGSLKELEERVKGLEGKPSPRFQVRNANAEGKLSTGRSYGHSHDITLVIEEIK